MHSCSQAEPGARVKRPTLHHVVAGSLPSVDVKNLTCHKTSAIEVEHRIYNVEYISHPTHWMERRQRLMRIGVLIIRGDTALMRTPVFAYSIASAFSSESGSVPTHERLGPNDRENLQD
jgi:hypothetical protein